MTSPLPGVVIAAPNSGAGKTTITLALLRALARDGDGPVPAKIGPDYIDPQFHRIASGQTCVNLDPWAMKPEQVMSLIGAQSRHSTWMVAEGVMGLYDGARGMGRCGFGSTADIATLTGWPVVLVLDATGQGATMAAIVRGLKDHRPHMVFGGVILNKVGSGAHVGLLKEALEEVGLPVLGAVPRDSVPTLSSRHLGLEQAVELRNSNKVMNDAADAILRYVDVAAIRRLAGQWSAGETQKAPTLVPPLGQRIAVAHDPAFAFVYDHVLSGWEAAGANILPFSPLEDQPVDPACDAIYLPGGYPELNAGRLAAAATFKSSVRRAAEANIPIYGECGGFMVLGRGIQDKNGHRHMMLGVLEHETSFATPRLHLGYRTLDLTQNCALGRSGKRIFGHEFHYAHVTRAGSDQPLGHALDATGRDLGLVGGRRGSVCGSFFHMIAV